MKSKNFKIYDKSLQAIRKKSYIEAIILLVQNYENITIHKLKSQFKKYRVTWRKTKDDFKRLEDYNVAALMYLALVNGLICLDEYIKYKEIIKLRNDLAHNILKNKKIRTGLVKEKIEYFINLAFISEEKRLKKLSREMQGKIEALEEFRPIFRFPKGEYKKIGKEWYVKTTSEVWEEFKPIK